MRASLLSIYLQELRSIRATGSGVAETSYYPPLSALMNACGAGLRPRVHCVMNLANVGAGLPDGGLFTADQLQSGAVRSGQLPARGAIEAKATSEDVAAIAASEQVQRYLTQYGQVLVTTFRAFLLVVRTPDGGWQIVDAYSLASSDMTFWNEPLSMLIVSNEGAFEDFLRRAMLYGAPIGTPKDLADLMAAHAREALRRLERASSDDLASVRGAMQEALGITFVDERGEHFFRSTLVQTLFYGIFSAWVLWHRQRPDRAEPFDWRTAAFLLRVPAIQVLFEHVALPSQMSSLGLEETLGWTGDALNRVDRSPFFQRFEAGAAVQYFYEPFLEAFDPDLRKQLGVWYTPHEIVTYQVARVDDALRTELGIESGLADPRVHVLDPCCGTGAYLIEVLKRIATTLREQGSEGLLGQEILQAALTRIHGFELLPAPYVVAHLQLGLLLQAYGASLDNRGERAGVYLTNALTGWQEDPDHIRAALPGYEGLMRERDAAQSLKRTAPILVVIGNPPYSGFAGTAVGEERALTDAYRHPHRASAPQGQGLNDLYVRFFRMAERQIVEQTGRGVVSFISNYSWLDGLSFTGMRERFLDVFDRIDIDCLNGDKYKTGKVTPWGEPDPSVFSTKANPEGIQVGTSIATLVRGGGKGTAEVRFRQFWGAGKRTELVATVGGGADHPYESIQPQAALGFPFAQASVSDSYLAWPRLPELFPTSFPGVKTSRDDFLVDIDRDRLEMRLRHYFDPRVGDDEIRRLAPTVMNSTALFDAVGTRQHLMRRGFRPEQIIRYAYRPYDVRWLYWEAETNLLDRKRSSYVIAVGFDQPTIVSQQKPRGSWSPPQLVQGIGCLDLMDRSATCFPLSLRHAQTDISSSHDSGAQGIDSDGTILNASSDSRLYIRSLNAAEQSVVFYHSLAILHSPAYSSDNAGALRQDWPRIPLPTTRAAIEASATLGRKLADLFDAESDVSGITNRVRPELRLLAVAVRVNDVPLGTADLRLAANWGYAGRGGVTMPGAGRAQERAYSEIERVAIIEWAERMSLEPAAAWTLVGKTTYDIFLNDHALWRNVPSGVWRYNLGGYQVLKKWLSYREDTLIDRPLRVTEIQHFVSVARRIASILLLGPELDGNYRAIAASAVEWPVLPESS